MVNAGEKQKYQGTGEPPDAQQLADLLEGRSSLARPL